MLVQMALRTLTPDDAAAYRELRLTALQESPTAFGSSVEQERARTLAQTAERLEETATDFVLGSLQGGRLLGVVGLHRHDNLKERHKAFMWGMYVHADARRSGIGLALVGELVARARRLSGLLQVSLAVEATNLPAKSLYEALGFRQFGFEERALIVDGLPYDEIHMVLMLDRSGLQRPQPGSGPTK